MHVRLIISHLVLHCKITPQGEGSSLADALHDCALLHLEIFVQDECDRVCA